jgi:uncharacterized DUF497 family protein
MEVPGLTPVTAVRIQEQTSKVLWIESAHADAARESKSVAFGRDDAWPETCVCVVYCGDEFLSVISIRKNQKRRCGHGEWCIIGFCCIVADELISSTSGYLPPTRDGDQTDSSFV